MENIDVSIIMPVYNQEAYLAQSIASVLAQTYQNFEVIVVDDGSTDGTHRVASQFADRIRYVRQENAGVASARNHGIRLARGAFIRFVDGDDFIHPDKLGAQVALIKENPRCAMVNSGWWLTDEQGTITACIKPWEFAPKLDLLTLLYWKPFSAGSILFRKSALDEINGFDTALIQSQDVDAVLRIMLAGYEAVWLKEPTFYYRQHSQNVTKKYDKQVASLTQVMDKFFALPTVPPSIRKEARRVKFFTHLWLFDYLVRATTPDELSPYLEQHLDAAWHDLALVVVFYRAFTITEADAIRAKHIHTLQVANYRQLPHAQQMNLLQAAIISAPSIAPAQIDVFWRDALANGLITQARRYDIIDLYLTLFRRASVVQQWQLAYQVLFKALRISHHPKAILPWMQFFGKLFIHAPQKAWHYLIRNG